MTTGLKTRYGAIAARLKSKPVETDFARGIRRFGEMLIRVMLVVVVLVLIANQLLGRPFLDSCCFRWPWASGCRRNCCRPWSA